MIERTRSSALAALIVLTAAAIPAFAARGATSGRAASSVNAPSSVIAASSGRAASPRRAASAGAEQARRSAAIQVTEATGIRRTEYPVNARVPLPRGALADAAHARLRLSDADQPAQSSAES